MITTINDISREIEPILSGGMNLLKKFSGGSVKE
jgi:hypothetical protein